MAIKRKDNNKMLFNAWNYKVLAIGFFLIVAGFLAMYLENEVNGIISLYISPIMIVGGYISIVFAILKKGPSSSPSQNKG